MRAVLLQPHQIALFASLASLLTPPPTSAAYLVLQASTGIQPLVLVNPVTHRVLLVQAQATPSV